MEAILFIGIQASGKSTFFAERFFKTHVRINLDMLRTRHREELLVKACLEAVGQRHPGFLDQVVAPDGSVHRFVNLFLNGDELERAGALDQAVAAGDEVEILAAIAGG